MEAYAAHGITVSALTMQNEPDNPQTSYPGMMLTAGQEARLAPMLGRRLAAAGLRTQILGFDSDWSDESFAAALMASRGGRWLSGSAFHCYAGDPSAQLTLRDAFPTKGVYETECSGTNAFSSFGGNLVHGTRSLVIDSVRDFSKTVLLWNMVLDQNLGPTNGGCTNCVPIVTINSATGAATDIYGYYMLGQVSRFVRPGARRIGSTDLAPASVETVAFQNPDGSDVLVTLNTSTSSQAITVRSHARDFSYELPAGSVETFTWR